ncbi:copper-binding protein, plastocyanin/azurin family [Roseobacter sp. SK209-2-6]|uniref:cupredoxin domain-containing protein n=1 Tax=Roseobacter sp. SK209-2-6 TaxID=388739 RepID=UPI0000F3F37C|nr:cupredoxin family copper-binding protein [Roseobacter sp. SK209-2-6]EBA14665.1 copper-binding protein, plastocyanin/azurin family [Roseobacter sp. SK209-2-6]
MRITRRNCLRFSLLLPLGLVPIASRASDQPVRRVEIRRFTYSAEVLIIKAGDRVEWVNADFAPHTATAEDGSWGSGELAKGESASLAFDQPGTFPYFCAFHPHMTATIIVED